MLKKFKSLFVIEEPKKEGAASGEETAREAGPTPRSRPVMPAVAGAAEAGQIQDKLLDVLFGALEESNLEGFDYMEFKDFLKSLANVPMDDATRFKSAFATAQTMGATKDVILKSANHYLEVLAREEAKFQEALTARRETDLTGKQDQIRGLEEEIRTKEATIEKLKAEIEGHRKDIGQVEEEINAAAVRIQQTANDFEATYQALSGQIKSDIQQIETHL